MRSEASSGTNLADRIIGDFHYRPEVDGLRAVAVLAVVLYHAGLGLSGGFIGVDVFFVISGFLITSLIVCDLQNGKFTLGNFWERRARRIVPALAGVVLATLITGWWLLLPGDYAALGKSAAWQAVFGANFYFWRTTLGGYFAGAADEMPLLHTWSLAVEEHFYVIFPLVFAALIRFRLLFIRHVLLILFGVGILVSFLASLYGVAYYRIAAFYLLPTRAWELLIGAALAVLPPTWMTEHRPTRELISYLGLCGIVAPTLCYTQETPFPGLAAVPPCLGAALIIWSSGHPTTRISLQRFLGIPPVVFIGLISYSLYLWHWPIFAYSNYYLSGETVGLGHRMVLIGLALGLGTLSWRFIERPFRRRTLCGSRKGIFGFGTAALSMSLAIGAGIAILHGFPQRVPEAIRASLASDPEDDFLFAKDIGVDDIQKGKLPSFGSRDSGTAVSVLVWGDSHAMSALPAFDSLLKAKGLSGRAAIHSSTPPVLGYFQEGRWGLGRDAPHYQEEVVSYIERRRIPHVVLISGWRNYVTNSSGSVEAALLTTVKRLVGLGCQPWVFLDVPGAGCDVRKVLRRATLMNINERRFCSYPGPWNGINGTDPLLLDRLIEAGARIIDPRPAFLDPSQEFYLNAMDGAVLYRDGGHLTKLGAERVLIPVLEKSFFF